VHCNAEHSAEQLTIQHNLQLLTNNTRHSDTDVRHGCYIAHNVSMDLQVQSYAGMLHEYF